MALQAPRRYVRHPAPRQDLDSLGNLTAVDGLTLRDLVEGSPAPTASVPSDCRIAPLLPRVADGDECRQARNGRRNGCDRGEHGFRFHATSMRTAVGWSSCLGPRTQDERNRRPSQVDPAAALARRSEDRRTPSTSDSRRQKFGFFTGTHEPR